jgi:hypothetical protein
VFFSDAYLYIIFSLLAVCRVSGFFISISGAKVFRVLNLRSKVGAGGLAKNLPLSRIWQLFAGERIFSQNRLRLGIGCKHPYSRLGRFLFAKTLHRRNTTFFCPRNSNNTPAPIRHGVKKKSKIMIRTEKNRKQRTSNLPISIGWVLKIGFWVAGFALWGWTFVAWVVGLYIGLKLLKGILSCFLSLLLIIASIILLTVLIF